MNSQCAVQLCEMPGDQMFTVSVGGKRGLPLHWPVCVFHETALLSGEAYEVTDDSSEIVLGSASVPQVINVVVDDNGIGAPVITLFLGHDGIESQRVRFRIGKEMLDEMQFWAREPELD
jgi:hypothetical protein